MLVATFQLINLMYAIIKSCCIYVCLAIAFVTFVVVIIASGLLFSE